MDRVPKIVFSFFSCEDIVNFCDIHSKFLFSNHSKDILKGKTCCESYFNMEPRFTYTGTCYTTRQLVLETIPSIFSSITLWLTGLRKSRLIGNKIIFCLYILGIFLLINDRLWKNTFYISTFQK